MSQTQLESKRRCSTRPSIRFINLREQAGWSPEGEAMLRRRIAERGITWLDASTVYIWAAYMRWLGRPMIFNRANWGLADSSLPETIQSPVSSTASS